MDKLFWISSHCLPTDPAQLMRHIAACGQYIEQGICVLNHVSCGGCPRRLEWRASDSLVLCHSFCKRIGNRMTRSKAILWYHAFGSLVALTPLIYFVC
jgi:hypothetical protein